MSDHESTSASFHPSGWDVPDETADLLTEAGILPRISDEEVERLRSGMGVSNPAPMRSYATLEELRVNLNNFPLGFITPREEGYTYGIIYRRKAWFQRLEVMAPEVVAELFTGQGMYSDDRPEQWWKLLHQAHQLATQLVSRDDPGVVDGDGEVDQDYLTK